MVNVCFSSKSFRVLVADPQSEQRSLIEKDLNVFGYYRIATASSFRDLVTLTHYSPDPGERFDLLIVNANLITAAGINARDFCLNNPRLRHALIYEPERQQRWSKTFTERPRQQVRLIRTIDRAELMDFLLAIDPAFEADGSLFD
ncbi:hypothetical protein K5E40_04025 [Pseudomonas baetica]|uniref:hypothetical protein n=1 Tax=Pseudomonas TaxID=286 RepID=UPI001C8C8ABC|nr:hypothetical protein [Pseudomonas baetica]MBX9404843.1 hypothetical protein [Pseudomonas baetica]